MSRERPEVTRYIDRACRPAAIATDPLSTKCLVATAASALAPSGSRPRPRSLSATSIVRAAASVPPRSARIRSSHHSSASSSVSKCWSTAFPSAGGTRPAKTTSTPRDRNDCESAPTRNAEVSSTPVIRVVSMTRCRWARPSVARMSCSAEPKDHVPCVSTTVVARPSARRTRSSSSVRTRTDRRCSPVDTDLMAGRASKRLRNTWNPSRRENSSHTLVPRTLLPRSSTSGEKTPTPA